MFGGCYAFLCLLCNQFGLGAIGEKGRQNGSIISGRAEQ